MTYAKNHALTVYQLACGYLQQLQDAEKKLSLTLWHEHGCYHVRLCHYKSDEHVGWIVWESMRLVTDARKTFKRIKKEYGLKWSRA